MFLLGCFVGSFFFPRAADIWGRKPVFLIGLLLYMFVAVSFFFIHKLKVAYLMLFVGGIAETGGYYIAYVYIVEQFPEKS